MRGPRRSRNTKIPCAAVAAALLVAALGCAKKQSAADAGPAAPGVDVAPPAPTGESADDHKTEAREDDDRNAAGRPGPVQREPVLPGESSAGGAAIWVTAPSLARTIDRVVGFLDSLRAAGADLLGSLPSADALAGQVEQMLRGGLFAQLLGLGDPTLVALSQPVRMRVSFPPSAPPAMVVSFGTTRPVEPTRTGKLAGVATPDGRYLVGIGVEPDVAAPWPPEEPGAAGQDVSAVIDVGTALPALFKAIQDLEAMASRLGGSAPMPGWLPQAAAGMARYVTEVAGMERMTFGLQLPATAAEPPLRMTMGFRSLAGSPIAAALAVLGQSPPPFGLLETVDAGGDMWVAARMNPEGVRMLLAALAEPTTRFLTQMLDEEWSVPLVELYAATVEAFGAVDGQMVGASRTLPGGKGSFTFVWGIAAGQADTARAGVRKVGALAAGLLTKLSEKLDFGATIQWTEKAARSGAVEVDRLVLAVPRAALGPLADALQPGAGDLRWEISFAVGPSAIVMTSDADPAVLQRALSGRAQGGGVAGGSPLAPRLASPEPGLLELGALDLAAGFRSNPALSCPPGTAFPALPMTLEMRMATEGFDVGLDFLPGSAASVFPFLKAMTSCVPGSASAGAPPPAP